MIRVVIENILLFLLPTALYVAFMLLRNRHQRPGSARQIIDDAPIVWLLVAGAIVMIAGNGKATLKEVITNRNKVGS